MLSNKQAFTLIELLVVVLIIGILAAVALPQYQKAVIKSRLVEYETNLTKLADMFEVCKLSKGSVCTIDELDIEIPACTGLPGYFDSCSYGWSGSTSAPVVLKNGVAGSVAFQLQTSAHPFQHYTAPSKANGYQGGYTYHTGFFCALGNNSCQKLGFTNSISGMNSR